MGENRVIKAALLGLGTVGTGVYKVLHAQKRRDGGEAWSLCGIKIYTCTES